ncbi:hypothetical protein AWM75_00265 [Aerococcus urinaehominis]|uniref:Uncharacterized protein n=1 Tax=Aerococcus urinaehominis TaxID=128944 RepID=A0A0X8FJS9_9LACT|nr:RDD family protein [Aerococcus urinaehominis]AMB98517.1 hypothetical protein AWM75_00265 [Aerococcus urinaehominis]SDL79824.1 Uncharacterized membrane protein YckC, RDD family [Aerococcus urinaehominis]
MFRPKSKKAGSPDYPAPELNQSLYAGQLEAEITAAKADRQDQVKSLDLQALLAVARQNFKRPLTTAFSRQMYAGFWSRLWAFLLDMAIVASINQLVIGLVSIVWPHILTTAWLTYLVYQLLLISYFSLASYWTNGQSIGKALFKIQLVHDEYRQLPFSMCLVRDGLGKMILTHLPILAVVVIFTPNRRNYMDFFTDTTTINLKQIAFLYENI